MASLLQDFKYAARILLANPVFTGIAVLTLALGVGANTAIFSVVNAVVLEPLPYERSDRIVYIWGQLEKYGLPRLWVSQPEYLDYRERSRSFASMAAYASGNANLTGSEKPVSISASQVTADFFTLLGARPAHGRVFEAADDRPGAPGVLVLSHGLWQSQFSGARDIVGRAITVNAEPYTVIGVMPPGFGFPSPTTQAWAPMQIDPADLRDRGSHYLRLIARLQPGVTIEQAGSEMDNIARQLENEFPDNYKDFGWGIHVVPMKEQVVGGVRHALVLLMGAVGCVALIACANVANLLLARATSREKEVAIRSALGAGRGRLIRQLLTESLMLALLGGAGGLLLAFWGIDLLLALGPSDLPRLDEIAIDGKVLAFTAGIAVLTGLVFGLIPALQVSRPRLSETLKDGGRASAGLRRRRAGSLLVVAEVAVAVVLLIGAGLMIRSFSRLLSVDTGYDSRGLLTGRLILTASSYPEPPRVQSFFDTLLSRLEALPGVEAAAAVSQLPLSGPFSSGTIAVEDRQADPDNSDVETDQIVVAGDYFRTMGISLLSGRYFTAADAAGAPGVAIVDEMMARRFWPDSDPVGRRIKFGSLDSGNPWLTIVGVVRHIKNTDLDSPGREQTYTPLAQRSTRGMSVVIRAASDAGGPGGAADAAQLAGPLREAVLAIDPQQPIFSVQTMDEVVDAEVAEPRFSMLLLLLFAGIAAALAAIGIYGMMAWSVTQRNHEIAIRMALGAQRPDVLRMVLAQGLRLTLAGVLFGLAGAFALTRTMSSLLFDVSALDPATYVAVALLLALVAMAAVWVPARRATRADPMIALRYE